MVIYPRFGSGSLPCPHPLTHPLTRLLRPVPQVSDVAVVTATRDGMNLVPYEYVVCRQGPEAAEAARQSMLVVSGGQGVPKRRSRTLSVATHHSTVELPGWRLGCCSCIVDSYVTMYC